MTHVKGEGKSGAAFVLRFSILILICVLAFATRLFSVLRYESVIHEFDPWFNFRTTRYLVKEGFYNFLNYFDSRSWYPMGRLVGETVYPGLMVTAGFLHWLLNSLHFTVDIRNVCVLLAPFFACNTVLAIYLFTKEVTQSYGASLTAAALVSIVPGYMSRSVAGSYDNEAVAIFALIFTFYLWCKAVNTGSLFWSACCALGYFYMVAAWGGYIFITNLIPLHVLALLIIGRFSNRLYIAYCVFFSLGLFLSMQVPFIRFHPIQSGDHLAAFGMFGLLQLYACFRWLYGFLRLDTFRAIVRAIIVITVLSLVSVGLVAGFLFTGRLYALLDPTYAKNHIPIIASVSEHQPITWSTYIFDLHILPLLIPVGLFFLFSELSDTGLFLILYALTSLYFSSSMVRLVLVHAPVACVLGGVALSNTLNIFLSGFGSRQHEPSEVAKKENTPVKPQKVEAKQRKTETPKPVPKPAKTKSKVPKVAVAKDLGILVSLAFLVLSSAYVYHCNWVTSEAYSSPSIVLLARGGDGSKIIFDDFREAYYWLRHNTHPEAKVMSWWDYGYQISGMANRTVIVDNNTRNNTHIAQVGEAFASTEEMAYPIIRRLDVDYVLVVFGGLIGYASDDINKFLWMVRIAGGVNPRIKESDFLTNDGQYIIGSGASSTMLNCLMYKLSYYRFSEVYTTSLGFDRVRHEEVGVKNIRLRYFEEAFTSTHWMVRIYRFAPRSPRNRHPKLGAFLKAKRTKQSKTLKPKGTKRK